MFFVSIIFITLKKKCVVFAWVLFNSLFICYFKLNVVCQYFGYTIKIYSFYLFGNHVFRAGERVSEWVCKWEANKAFWLSFQLNKILLVKGSWKFRFIPDSLSLEPSLSLLLSSCFLLIFFLHAMTQNYPPLQLSAILQTLSQNSNWNVILLNLCLFYDCV